MTEVLDDIFSTIAKVVEVKADSFSALEQHLSTRQPFIVRGLVDEWPLVKKGQKSGRVARDYLLEKHKVGRPFGVTIGAAREGGRIFYRDDMSMNVQNGRALLPEIFDRIDKIEQDNSAEAVYIASVDMPQAFKGLHSDNGLDFGERQPRESIWIGTQTRIAAHNDFPQNLACVAVGRRRFTLFPPDQIDNLYIGPIDNTPAGRAISMVDFHAPDYNAFPRFNEALLTARTAELEPGDAIYIPSMWWHHVEGLAPFNVLINYWWRDTPRYLGQPQNALNHAIMTIRDLPDDEKMHWRNLFEHYVFENADSVIAHIPPQGRSVLDPMTAENASKIRSFLIRMLSDE